MHVYSVCAKRRCAGWFRYRDEPVGGAARVAGDVRSRRVLCRAFRTGRTKMRWALCTDDIYYAHPVLKNIFTAGRTMPIKRTRGMEQPLFKVTTNGID